MASYPVGAPGEPFWGPSAQNTLLGCICEIVDCRAAASSFLFLSQKERKRSLSALRAAYGGCAPRRAFCEADVPEGARSDPSGLGAEMLPPDKVFRLLRQATKGVAFGIHRPLKRAALNFRPFVTQSFSWVLPGDLGCGFLLRI